MAERNHSKKPSGRGWDPVAGWYTGWVGVEGSDHHRRVAIPAVLDLLKPSEGERVLDVGCGPGVLAPHIRRAGARYIGIDASTRLITFARKHHGEHGKFLVADATDPRVLEDLGKSAVDASVFLLSIQDIDPLEAAIRTVSEALRSGGRVVLLMTHPCFRVPRQSGWGWDEQRRLQFRRVDRYLTPLAVPMKRYGKGGFGATRSHHRPLQQYVDALVSCGLVVNCVREIPTYRRASPGHRAKAEKLANEEIPLFLGLRAMKL